MAEALYRKYRPQVFADVVGQDHIVRTLQNAISQNKVSHAYLFCGPRGTGKTTMARLLSKALLCGQGPTPDPDGTCEDCQLIAAGTHPDVYELDAASRTGVENVREEIIGRVQFAPTRGASKIYIIDEVHMLSTAAFNALLKTLEEPPGHVVFVLCTTDPQKVPETIHSRCQRFDFRRIGQEAMVAKLGAVCVAEGVEFDGEALELVAHRADGGMRNALTALEQLMAFSGNHLTMSAAEDMLGGLNVSDVAELVAAIGRRDAAACFDWVARYVETGGDLAQFARDLAEHLRNMYVMSLVGRDVALDVSDAVATGMAEALQWYGPDRLARALVVLGDLMAELRTSTNARLSFEIACVRLTRPEGELTLESLAERLERLEREGVRMAAVASPVAMTQPAVVAQTSGEAQTQSQERAAQGQAGQRRAAEPDERTRRQQGEGATRGQQSQPAQAQTIVQPQPVQTQPQPQSYEEPARPVSQSLPQSQSRTERGRQKENAFAGVSVAAETATAASTTSGVSASSGSAGAAGDAASAGSPVASGSVSADSSVAAGVANIAPLPADSAWAKAADNPAALQRLWQQVLAVLKREKGPHAVLFMNTRVTYDAGHRMVCVVFPREAQFAFKAVQKPDVGASLAAASATALGFATPFAYVRDGEHHHPGYVQHATNGAEASLGTNPNVAAAADSGAAANAAAKAVANPDANAAAKAVANANPKAAANLHPNAAATLSSNAEANFQSGSNAAANFSPRQSTARQSNAQRSQQSAPVEYHEEVPLDAYEGFSVEDGNRYGEMAGAYASDAADWRNQQDGRAAEARSVRGQRAGQEGSAADRTAAPQPARGQRAGQPVQAAGRAAYQAADSKGAPSTQMPSPDPDPEADAAWRDNLESAFGSLSVQRL